MHDTHISAQIRAMHSALLEIAGVLNRPQQDEMMVREAGISLDRALFPLLMRIESLGPIGVVDLADRVGRDHTTVSRQVARLESLGLVERQGREADRRVRQAIVTPGGKAMTNAVDAARERLGQAVFASWEPQDVSEFIRLISKFAQAMSTNAGQAL